MIYTYLGLYSSCYRRPKYKLILTRYYHYHLWALCNFPCFLPVCMAAADMSMWSVSCHQEIGWQWFGNRVYTITRNPFLCLCRLGNTRVSLPECFALLSGKKNVSYNNLTKSQHPNMRCQLFGGTRKFQVIIQVIMLHHLENVLVFCPVDV